MQNGRLLAIFVLLLPASAIKVVNQRDSSSGTEIAENAANPIRKVVTLLQKMQAKVTAEGKREKELYDKYVCYCKNGDASLTASIASAGAQVTDLGASIQEAEARKAQSEMELKDHQSSRSDAKAAVAQATSLREKEAKAFAKESGDLKANIAALTGAIAAISKGMSGGFLQAKTVSVIRKLALSGPSMSDGDRQTLLSFLSAQLDSNSDYAPKSGEITGILTQLKDDMSKSLEEITSDENGAIASYEELKAAKQKEIAALSAAIESKMTLVGELAVRIAAEKNDLSDTQAALLEDQKFLADLSKDCDAKAKEMEERQATRADELVALADTIKVLNDDEALELFKKTLPTPALLQVEANADKVRTQALSILATSPFSNAQRIPRPSNAGVQLDLITMALHGKRAGFEKVIKMIDNMISLMKQEQADDDSKRDYCGKELDKADDQKKSLEQTIADEEAAIADAEESIGALASEIKALEKGVKALDESVAAATDQRKKEHDEYTDLIANDAAAKEIIAWAKNRLAKFYTPKLYRAPPKRDLGEDQSSGGDVAFTQVSHRLQQLEAPPPPPETWDAYAKKSEENSGVIAMLDLLVKSLDKEMAEAGVEEKNAQVEYEEMMSDSAAKRATDSRSITGKQSMKAGIETALETHRENKDGAGKELLAATELLSSLHSECDWLLQYYETRKEARASEMAALGNAKAVLSGADFSFLQHKNLRH